MKLSIGENIRKFRHKLDLTQEQMGNLLGVSCQAVSRWENGTAYPDIEFLPTLANFFEISVDELLGYGENERKRRANDLMEQLKLYDGHDEKDGEKIIAMIRELRRDHIFDCGHDFWFSAGNFYNLPGVLPELRMTAEKILDKSTNKYQREEVIYHMAKYEDDEHIEDFLKKHAAVLDITYYNLLQDRYEFRGDTDKYEIMNQLKLYDSITELTGNFQMGEMDRNLPDEEMIRVLRFQLDILNWFCRIHPTEEHPVFCDDVIDEWSSSRVMIGLRLAGHLAKAGYSEMAFTALEDVVSMLERIIKLIDETEGGLAEVAVRCEWLSRAEVRIERFSLPKSGEPVILINRWKIGQFWISEGRTGPEGAIYVLTSEKCRYNYLFDSIRDDSRYRELVGRLNVIMH